MTTTPSSDSTETALQRLGYRSSHAQEVAELGLTGAVPARVVAEHRGAYDLATAGEMLTARISGRTRRAAGSPLELPAVGDWVLAIDDPAAEDTLISAVLDRFSALVAPGRR